MNFPISPKKILVFTCLFFTAFSLTLIHPVNRTHNDYQSSTYGKLHRHVDRVWNFAVNDAAKPFWEVKDHYLFHGKSPGLFKFIAEITARIGAKSPIPLQIFLILLVNLGIIVQFKWLKLLFKNDIFPVIGCFFILGSHFLTYFGSTIHQHPYNFAFFNFCIFFILKYAREKKLKYYWLAWFSYLFLCQNYYMFWVSTFIMMVGILWIEGNKLISLRNFTLGLAPVLTMIFLILNISYASGGFDKGFPKLTKIYKARVLGIVEKGDVQKPLTKKDYYKYPLTVSSRVERYFYIPGIAFIFLGWILLRLRRKNNSKLDYRVFRFLIPAGLSWYLLVYEHTVVHQVAGRYSYFLWMLFFGFFFTEIIDYVNKFKEGSMKTFLKYTWVFILIYSGYGFMYLNILAFVKNVFRLF